MKDSDKENIQYLQGLDNVSIPSLLFLEDIKYDWSFFDGFINSCNEHFASIERRFNKLVADYRIPIRLFETNEYYDSNLDQNYLSFWKNENALTDIIVSAIINNKTFWGNLYLRLLQETKSKFIPDLDFLKVKREDALQINIESTYALNSERKKGRSDIIISYLNENNEKEYLHIEHKIGHDLDEDQVELYCNSALEYRNIHFVLITSKDSDLSIIEKNQTPYRQIVQSYSSPPIILNHLDLIKLFFKTRKNDEKFHYEWVIAWLFEIIKKYRNEDTIHFSLNKPIYYESDDKIWEKLFLLNLLEG